MKITRRYVPPTSPQIVGRGDRTQKDTSVKTEPPEDDLIPKKNITRTYVPERKAIIEAKAAIVPNAGHGKTSEERHCDNMWQQAGISMTVEGILKWATKDFNGKRVPNADAIERIKQIKRTTSQSAYNKNILDQAIEKLEEED